MAAVDIRTALEGAPEFVAEAVEHLASCLGEAHPSVEAGRRALASLNAIPDGAVLVTEETLAVAIHRVWPYRQKTQSGLALSAASIIAALRADDGSS